MARTTTPIRRIVRFRDRDLPGFLDMLRYDQSTVVDWNTTSDASREVYEVTLQSAPGRTTGYEFTYDRWASFGLYLAEEPVR